MNITDFAIHKIAIMGLPNSGKSYHAMVWAERLMDANIPIVAVDPVGIWHGLKIGVDGNKGYPVVVAGGYNADIPLTLETIVPIMKAALEARVSIVFDLYESTSSKAHQKRLVTKLAEFLQFNNRPYGLRHVFLEEAAEFMPQMLNAGDFEVYGMLDILARTGRNHSIGMTFINQRAEQLNKSALEICEYSFWHKQNGRNSLKAIADWMKIKDVPEWETIINKIPQLKQGECYVMGEGETPTLIKTDKRKTYHPDPTQLEVNLEIVKQAVDVSGFVKELSKALEALSDDEEGQGAGKKKVSEKLKALQTKNTELLDEIKKINEVNENILAQNAQIIEQNTFFREEYAKLYKVYIGFKTAYNLMKGEANKWIDLATQKKKFLAMGIDLDAIDFEMVPDLNESSIAQTEFDQRLTNFVKEIKTGKQSDLPDTRKESQSHQPEKSADGGEKLKAKQSFNDLPKAERLIMNFLAGFKDQQFDQYQIAIVVGYSANSSNFKNTVRSLIAKGMVIKTGAGEETIYSFRAGSETKKYTGASVTWSLTAYIKRLPKAEGQIVCVLLKENTAIGPELIADLTESKYSSNSSNFKNSIRAVCSKELVLKKGKGAETLYQIHPKFKAIIKLFRQ
jgi:hypothetical protein